MLEPANSLATYVSAVARSVGDAGEPLSGRLKLKREAAHHFERQFEVGKRELQVENNHLKIARYFPNRITLQVIDFIKRINDAPEAITTLSQTIRRPQIEQYNKKKELIYRE